MERDRKKRMIGVFEALSSGVRLDIFRLLVTNEPEGLVAGEIAKRLSLAATNLSFHLKAMTHAGLLSVSQEGRFLRYRARVDLMEEVIAYLTENCCGNRPELCGPPESASSPDRPGRSGP